MNTVPKTHLARRGVGRIVPVAVPADVADLRALRRCALIGAWSVDPVSSRLVCSWSRAPDVEDRPEDEGAGEDGDIPLTVSCDRRDAIRRAIQKARGPGGVPGPGALRTAPVMKTSLRPSVTLSLVRKSVRASVKNF